LFEANHGNLGVGTATTHPGNRAAAASWTDFDGNLWLFGGIGYVERDNRERFFFSSNFSFLQLLRQVSQNSSAIFGNTTHQAFGLG
jgi:hypothetical protein